jgi:excisionase family DNA binding protein
MKLYTVKEAAKIVGVSTNTLYKYLDEDRIHAARGSAIQGRFRIPESALEEFLGVKLSEPEPTPSTGTVPERNARLQVEQGSSADEGTVPMVTTSTMNHKLPIKITRFLLVLALLAMLIDLFIARAVSLPASLSRLFFLAVTLLLAYQEGGYRRS